MSLLYIHKIIYRIMKKLDFIPGAVPTAHRTPLTPDSWSLATQDAFIPAWSDCQTYP